MVQGVWVFQMVRSGWSGGQGGQGGQKVRWSGGPGGKVIRAVKVSMMARVVQTESSEVFCLSRISNIS